MTKQVAETILAQLGGRRFIAMTGAKNFLHDGAALLFDLPRGAATNKATKVRIELTAADDYTMRFFRLGRRDGLLSVIEISNDEFLFYDQLQETFTERTGLHTSL